MLGVPEPDCTEMVEVLSVNVPALVKRVPVVPVRLMLAALPVKVLVPVPPLVGRLINPTVKIWPLVLTVTDESVSVPSMVRVPVMVLAPLMV